MFKNALKSCWIPIGLIIVITLLYAVGRDTGTSQSCPDHPNVAEMSLPAWLGIHQQEGKPASPAMLDAGIEIARQRKQRMEILIQKDPLRALGESVSRSEWEALPDQIKPLVEEPVQGIANVEVYIGCGPDHAQMDRWTTIDGQTSFRTFTPPGNRFARTRKGVFVSGIRLGDIGALWNAFDYDPDQPSEPLAASEGTAWQMYVILVDFSDWAGEPVNPGNLENLINGSVSQQVYEMSNYQTYVNCTVNPKTYRLDNSISYYKSDHIPMHADAVSKVEADGIDLSGYDTVCVYFRRYTPITFAGYASLPGSQMWINGYYSENVITHELGHNLGSYHASSWDVETSDPADPAGISTEYGDPLDIMGSGQVPKGHFHVQNMIQVGWLTGTNFTDADVSGTYRVYRSDHPQTDPTTGQNQGIRITKGTNEYYWLGYRQLYTELETIGRGLYVLWQRDDPYGYEKSHLLDMTPGSAGGKTDGGLAIGKTYSDPAAGIHITPVKRGGYSPNEYMDVVVNLGSFPGNSDPVATIDGPPAGYVMDSMKFSVTASDPEDDELAYAWDYGDGIVQENAASTSHAFTSSGPFLVSCTITDMKGGNTTVSMPVTISHPLESWTNVGPITPANYHLNDIVAGNGKLVTVGIGGAIATSDDGETWTTRYIGGSVYWQGVVFDGTQFVAAGNRAVYNGSAWEYYSTVYSSPDGATWTQRYQSVTPASAGRINDFAYGDGTYIAVGNGGYVLRTSNINSWSELTANNPNTSLPWGDFKSIGFDDGAFCVVGTANGGGPLVMITFSGFSWTDKTAQANLGTWPFLSIENCNGDLFCGGNWIGIGRSIDRGYNFSSVSDGYFNLTGFAHGNGTYLGVGNFNITGTADVNVVSADGINWYELTTPAQEDRNAVAFFNNCFVTVGKNGSVWRSSPIGDPQSGWATWQIHYGGALGLNRDNEDDSDGDSVENILEYALGTDPGDASSVPVLWASKDETGHLYVTIPRTYRAQDVEYVVEQTTDPGDPGNWNHVDTVVETDTETELTVRTLNPVSPANPRFLRLRVR